VLDNYLKAQAKQDIKKNVSVSYVLTMINSAEVIGYYTLSSISIDISELSDDVNIYLLAAKYYKEMDNKEKARYYYNEVLKINPDSVAAKDGLKNL